MLTYALVSTLVSYGLTAIRLSQFRIAPMTKTVPTKKEV